MKEFNFNEYIGKKIIDSNYEPSNSKEIEFLRFSMIEKINSINMYQQIKLESQNVKLKDLVSEIIMFEQSNFSKLQELLKELENY